MILGESTPKQSAVSIRTAHLVATGCDARDRYMSKAVDPGFWTWSMFKMDNTMYNANHRAAAQSTFTSRNINWATGVSYPLEVCICFMLHRAANMQKEPQVGIHVQR